MALKKKTDLGELHGAVAGFASATLTEGQRQLAGAHAAIRDGQLDQATKLLDAIDTGIVAVERYVESAGAELDTATEEALQNLETQGRQYRLLIEHHPEPEE